MTRHRHEQAAQVLRVPHSRDCGEFGSECPACDLIAEHNAEVDDDAPEPVGWDLPTYVERRPAGGAVTLRLRCSLCQREHTAPRPTRRGVEGWVSVVCCQRESTIYLSADGEPRVDGYCDPVRTQEAP